MHDGTSLRLVEVEAEVDAAAGEADIELGALPTGDTDDEEDSLEVVRPAVTRDAAAAASSAPAAPSVKSEAELARAAGVMINGESGGSSGWRSCCGNGLACGQS